MKFPYYLICISLVVIMLMLILAFSHWNTEKWIVEPVLLTTGDSFADNDPVDLTRERWKWRPCIVKRGGKGCGSPMSYDEALWWAQTEGGRKVERAR